MFDAEEIGFVICASCGARIKANRERCLRCEAPLVAWEKPEVLPTWLQRLGGGTLVFGIVGILMVAFGVMMFLDAKSRTTDDAVRPASAMSVPRTPSAPVPFSAIAPAAALEPQRRGNVDFLRTDTTALRARLEDELSKKPADPELLNNLGLTLERQGQLKAAVTRFETALQLDSQNWTYHFNLAHAAAAQQDWDRAIAEYRLVAGLQPGEYATRYNLAMSIHGKGDSASAIPELEKGIEMAPSVPAFHLALGACLEKLGRLTDAGREYQTYLDMAPSAPDVEKVRSHLQSLPRASS